MKTDPQWYFDVEGISAKAAKEIAGKLFGRGLIDESWEVMKPENDRIY